VKSLSRLHAPNSKSYERVIVGRVPEIVEPNAELSFFALVSNRVVRIDHDKMIADIYWSQVAVLSCGQPDVEYRAINKHSTRDFLGGRLHSRANRHIGKSANSCRWTIRALDFNVHDRLQQASLTANGGSTLHMAAINKKVIAVVGATGQQGGA
jgi:hypothetical protein